jgi:hypothetical protein
MANLTIAHTATEFTANAITLKRGTVADIVTVGVYHNVSPNTVPLVSDFIIVDLVYAPNALADGTNIDILSLIGPRSGDVTLTAGDYQRWCLVTTATEDIIRKVDVITIL